MFLSRTVLPALAFLSSLLLTTVLPAEEKQPARTLWEIGKKDRSNAEFALAPGNFAAYAESFKSDPLFVIEVCDPKADWPYVHPGPADAWAGKKVHTLTILFSLKKTAAGDCTLRLDLLDTHYEHAPQLTAAVNGKTVFARELPRGAGDESVKGHPKKGKPCHLDIPFEASLLKEGKNEIALAVTSGSWLLYDALALDVPPGVEAAPTPPSTHVAIEAAAAPAIVLKDGKEHQNVVLLARQVGREIPAVVRVNDAKFEVKLAKGANRLELPVPAVEKETPLAVTVESEGAVVAQAAGTLLPARKWVIYILPHSHNDIGYTALQTEIEKKQMHNIALGIELAKKTASYPEGSRFKWNVEVLWAVESYLKAATPEQQREFIAAVKAGQIGLDALYANELTALCRPEELIRLVSYAGELEKLCGVKIDSAMISDVPGLTWGMVPALNQAGVRYISDGVNYLDRIGGALTQWEDKPFWWIGPDGKDKVMVWTPYKGYALGHSGLDLGNKIATVLASLVKKNYPYDIAYIRWTHGDNGPPDEKLADKVGAWNEKHVYPKLIIATTGEMFRAFEKRYGEALPKFAGDFTPYWEDGAGSSARETAMNRTSAERMVQAQALQAMLGPHNYIPEQYWDAWRNILLYSEHTWGAHNSISHPDLPFVKDQWKIKQAFAIDGQAQANDLFSEFLQKPQGPVRAVDVFNTSSWPRTDLATLPAEMNLLGEVVQDEQGQTIPSQRLSSGELVFLAKDVPPFGGRRFTLHEGKAPLVSVEDEKADPFTLHMAPQTVRLDPKTGAIVEWKTAGHDANLLDVKSLAGLNEYFYLPGNDLKNLQRSAPAKLERREWGPLVRRLILESPAPGCESLTREIRLVRDLDRLEIIDTLDKKAVRTKEGVHFGFAFNVPDGTVRMEVPFAIVRPDADQIPGSCKNWFTVQRWVDVSNADFGVTWAPLDAPLVELGEISANLLGSQTHPEAWRQKVGPTQTIYSWVMNNHWHTNYKADQDGLHTFRYMLRPHKQFDAAQAARFGAECSQPLVVLSALNRAMPPSRLKIENANVLATCLKPSEDGKALIVRLWNPTDQPQKATLTWSPPAPAAMFLSDVQESDGEKLPGPIELAPRAVRTLRAALP